MLQVQEIMYFIDAQVKLGQTVTERKTKVVHSLDEVIDFLRAEAQLERVEIVKTTVSPKLPKFEVQSHQSQVSLDSAYVYHGPYNK